MPISEYRLWVQGMKWCQGDFDRVCSILFTLPPPTQRKANVVKANARKV